MKPIKRKTRGAGAKSDPASVWDRAYGFLAHTALNAAEDEQERTKALRAEVSEARAEIGRCMVEGRRIERALADVLKAADNVWDAWGKGSLGSTFVDLRNAAKRARGAA